MSAERALSSRETAYDHELRRHQRAPDARAAAMAKRAFVRKTPYLVTTAALPQPGGQPAAACGPPFVPLIQASSSGQGSAALHRAAQSGQAAAATSKQIPYMLSLELACNSADAVMPSLAPSPHQAGTGQETGASEDASSPKRSPRLEEKRTSGRLTSYKRDAKTPRTGAAQRAQGKQAPEAAAKKACVGSRAWKPAADRKGRVSSRHGKGIAANDGLPLIRSHDTSRPAVHYMGARSAENACTGKEQHPVQSLAERYAEMKRTAMERLTCGASWPPQDRFPYM